MAISASIKALLKGEQVAGSKMSSQLTDELMAEGLLSVVARGSRKSYRARNTEALRRYLIDKDESYRMLEIDVRLACLDGERYGQLQTGGRPIMSRISHKLL